MTTLTVFGGSGYAGSAVVAEAIDRGFIVNSISRKQPENSLPGVNYLAHDLTEGVPTLDGTDVIVAALSPRGSNVGKLPSIYRAIAAEAKRISARLIIVGGFSSLRPEAGAARFAEGELPAELVSEATEMNSILEELLASADADLNWLFVSPAAEFGSFAPGEATGKYRTSGDVALFDENGKSAISGADFAKAILDEVQSPSKENAHIHFAY